MREKFHTPWWLSALLAVVSYCSLKYIAPIVITGSFGDFLATLAPLAAMAFLLHSGAMLYEGDPVPDKEETDDKPGQENKTE